MIRQFVINRAWPELFVLRSMGGTNLRSLATDIYTGFGMFPGRDIELAAHLSNLPMEMVDDLPTFTYVHRGVVRPLLIRTQRYASDSIHPTMFVIKNEAYVELGIKNTRTLAWIVRGAQRLHTAMRISQTPEAIYTHIVSANKQAAVAKGITI